MTPGKDGNESMDDVIVSLSLLFTSLNSVEYFNFLSMNKDNDG